MFEREKMVSQLSESYKDEFIEMDPILKNLKSGTLMGRTLFNTHMQKDSFTSKAAQTRLNSTKNFATQMDEQSL